MFRLALPANKDPNVLLDERPVDTCIPHTFMGNIPAQLHGIANPQNIHASRGKIAKFGAITFS